MAPEGSLKRKRSSQSRSRNARQVKRQTEEQEVRDLESSAAQFVVPDDFKHFDQLPISSRTKRGLRKAGFTEMTDIQSRTLPLSLKCKDVLGAARTGSGKTLSFLIPALEILYRKKWGSTDGLGALIISPTRELAIQIFEVLRKIGPFHTFSAGLVIGGKDLKQEKDRLARMNILVATPGRLLQHMDQTWGFDCSNLQVLILDEADRILDMGFSKTLNAIVENLPKSRQTMLFSATQTKRVKDLARLSLQDPEYVAVREAEHEGSTPKNLEQHYMVVGLEKKLDVLYSFIRTHTKCKALVFMSSCRQVQFTHETFCKLRPGISLMALHGKQKQAKRLQIFSEFTRTAHAVLFATDIAARGLDFPAVDWVIQLDAPEDTETYIHRVGRTARYNAKGNSLLFVLPSEEKGMLEGLAQKNVPVGRIKPRESKTQSIQDQLQSFAFQDPEIKYLAQKAFVSYIRSIFLQKDKATFDVTALPLEKYASSLGLAGAPKVKFVKEAAKAKKAAAYKAAKETAQQLDADRDEESGDDDAKGTAKVRTKYDRMFERKNQNILSEHYAKLIAEDKDDDEEEDGDDEPSDGESASDAESTKDKLVGGNDSDSEDEGSDSGDFLTLKRADHALDDDEGDPGKPLTLDQVKADATNNISKRKLLQGQSKKAMALAGKRGIGEKLVFDEDGEAHALYELRDEDDFKKQGDAKTQAEAWEMEERARLQEADIEDKERAREKKREKKRKQKEREKQMRGEDVGDDQDEGEDGDVVLAPIDTRSDGYETPDFDVGSESEDEDEESHEQDRPSASKKPKKGSVEEQEALAMRLLMGDS
ncbi:DEAD-domain-containing protein [Violaceomyces palustris]|uniref:DEAD-domain-containing protein n=1 Tax=Violaceomyces palustris TaxID=1673888 RepID=A0ACD0NNV7_9BASI|nr:DEAD-domain-containing protein [Violaceomyces palustris]